MIDTKIPREQNGRDTFARYRAQARSAAIAALSILKGQEIDRIYCDLHDDFVVRKKGEHGNISYIFYQVKTHGKQNHNWTLNEVFGLKTTIKDQSKQSADGIKISFVGKLLLHTVIFDGYCNQVVFQTNIHNDDNVLELLDDIESGHYESKYSKVLIDSFNSLFSDQIPNELTPDDIKNRLAKLRFESDVQYLKDGNDNFEPIARENIHTFSEVDLGHDETKEILMKLLELVEKKSSGIITKLTKESIEQQAGIAIDDLLSILSISRDAYAILIKGGDMKAIRSASIIQRTLLATGASLDHVEYCSKCKTEWDMWLRKNRHVLPPLDLNTITSKVLLLLLNATQLGNAVSLINLRLPIKQLLDDLRNQNLLHDLTDDLILGGIFSELVRGKA